MSERTPLMSRKSKETSFFEKTLTKRHSSHSHGFRNRIAHFLESNRFQYFLMGLLVFDVILVISELALEAENGNEHNETLVVVEEIISYTSLSILCFFGLEQLLLMFAIDIEYFKNPWYIVDLIVISVSLSVELVFHQILAELLVVFRLWRIVRIIHGILGSMHETHQKEKEAIKEVAVKIEEAFNKQDYDEAKNELKNLIKMLK